GVNSKNRLTRIMVSETLVRSTEDRRDFWRQLKSLMPIDKVVDIDQISQQAQAEMAQKMASNLLSMLLSGDSSSPVTIDSSAVSTANESSPQQDSSSQSGDYEPLWIETPECDGCEECVKINPKIFVFNADDQAEVLNPKAGSYKDIVRAAEKCTVSCIHPGTPWNDSEKDLDKLVQRAQAFQ
ncbi:MAG: ferredoxin, partial [Gammaproteobacteria bacterium]|nr:ferredoxin [Gammaproteobacteria bacterium]